jgi:hypothetical protein
MYTVGMKYILNLFNNKSDLQIIKHNLSEIDNNILRILDKPKTKEDEYSKDKYNMSHFTLLNRARFYILNLENLNNYEMCTDLHYELFFLLYFGLIDVLDKFHRKNDPDIVKCFHNSIEKAKKAIGYEIINTKKLSEYISFIRAISFAHTASTNTAGGFLNLDANNSYFILTSIFPFRASWTKDDSKDDKKAFYFHAILKNGNNCKAIIFPVYY